MNPGIISPERSSDSVKFRFWLHIPHIIISFSILPLDVPYTLLYCTWLFLISLVISRQFSTKTKWKIHWYIWCLSEDKEATHSNQRQSFKSKAKNKNQCFPSSTLFTIQFVFPLTTKKITQVLKLVWEGLRWSVQFSWFNCFISFTALCLKIFHLHCSSQVTVNKLKNHKTPFQY